MLCLLLEDKTEKEVHLYVGLETLRQEKIHAKFSKHECWLSEVQFTGHVANQKCVMANPTQILAIMQWEVPQVSLKYDVLRG